jgi:glutathione S-transferase
MRVELPSSRCGRAGWSFYLANPMMMFTRFTHPALSALEPPEPAVGAYNLNTAEKMMKSLNRRLEGRDFIAADRITAADIVAYVGLDFATAGQISAGR